MAEEEQMGGGGGGDDEGDYLGDVILAVSYALGWDDVSSGFDFQLLLPSASAEIGDSASRGHLGCGGGGAAASVGCTFLDGFGGPAASANVQWRLVLFLLPTVLIFYLQYYP